MVVLKRRFCAARNGAQLCFLSIMLLWLNASTTAVLGSTAEQFSDLTVAAPSYNVNFLPIVVAQQKQFYAREQLRIKLIQLPTSQGVAALLAGSIQYYLAAGGAIGAAAKGAPLRLLMIIADKPNFQLVALPEIKTVTDLRGKVLVISSFGSTLNYVASLILQKHGLRRGEVLIVANRDNALSLSALESRQAQGAIVAPPFTVEAEKMGYNVLADAGFLELPTAGISATSERIEKRRQEVKAFLKATLLGIEFVKKNRTESISIMSKWLGLNSSVAARTYDLSVGNYNEDGQVPASSVKLVLDINSSTTASKATAEFPISRIIDMGPLNEVLGK